ncbi:rhodanese-like domain-containing protein [Halioxenophilus aromaticivorans]|uniref:Rhodanese domain-containing protein n=1 Tax=Halioxenophilus aromaticivorans TaxID=1306992 RepID=A0AAV3U520_9ALTE
MRNLHRVIVGLFLLLGLTTVTAEPEPLWLDVRTVDEYNADHIDGSVLLPHTNINRVSAMALGEKNDPIYVYCRSGRRSAIALKTLEELGFTNVTDLGAYSAAQQLFYQENPAPGE